jgi:transcriptional regulator with XRE-family HTH domain
MQRGETSFGHWVRQRRVDLLLTQEELARRSGLSVRTIRNLEIGRGGEPRLHTRRLLMAALGAGTGPGRSTRPEAALTALRSEAAANRTSLNEHAADKALGLIDRAQLLAATHRGRKRLGEIDAALRDALAGPAGS